MDVKALALAACAAGLCAHACAIGNGPGAYATQQGNRLRVTTPIFSQLLVLSYPGDFRPVYEVARGDQYLIESQPLGEHGKPWSQMIIVSAARGLAAKPHASLGKVLQGVASSFRQACPRSFAMQRLGPVDISGHQAFAAVVGCGALRSHGTTHSEATLVIVVRGALDLYTVQWAERGAARTYGTGAVFDTAKWSGRIKQLGPIKLCPMRAGETIPYPSCEQ